MPTVRRSWRRLVVLYPQKGPSASPNGWQMRQGNEVVVVGVPGGGAEQQEDCRDEVRRKTNSHGAIRPLTVRAFRLSLSLKIISPGANHPASFFFFFSPTATLSPSCLAGYFLVVFPVSIRVLRLILHDATSTSPTSQRTSFLRGMRSSAPQ